MLSGGVIEKIVVLQEIADYLGVRVPAFDVCRYGVRPRRHEQRILIAVADAVNAKNIEACHGEFLLRQDGRMNQQPCFSCGGPNKKNAWIPGPGSSPGQAMRRNGAKPDTISSRLRFEAWPT
jgi:hypothetical protein